MFQAEDPDPGHLGARRVAGMNFQTGHIGGEIGHRPVLYELAVLGRSRCRPAPRLKVGLLQRPERRHSYFKGFGQQAVQFLPVGLGGRMRGPVQDQPAPHHLGLEPGQLRLQGDQATGLDFLRSPRSRGQKTSVEAQEIVDKEIVLLEPDREGVAGEAALADAVEKRVGGGGPPFPSVPLLEECRRPGGPRGPHGHSPADEAAERAIRERLGAAFPHWGYLGEEIGERDGDGRHVWVVDPNDGTTAMQDGYRVHAISIALLRDRVPVRGVVLAVNGPDDRGDLFSWDEGAGPMTRSGVPIGSLAPATELRRDDVVMVSHAAYRHPVGNLRCVAPARFYGVPSIAYRLALVAAGEAVAGVSLNAPGAVDYAAGHALVRAQGGVFANETGEESPTTRGDAAHARRALGERQESPRLWQGSAETWLQAVATVKPGPIPAASQ